MAHVAILGANGKLGQMLVTRALDLGHWVHAFVRDTKKFKRSNELLSVYVGDAATGEGLDGALDGCAYVISAVDPGKGKVTPFIGHLVRLLEHRRLRRLVFISRLGVGSSAAQSRQASGLIAPFAASLNRATFEDIGHAEGVLRVSKLPYLILRTTKLTDDPPGAKVMATDEHNPPPSRVGRADLARFIFDVLELDGYDRQELTVGADRG